MDKREIVVNAKPKCEHEIDLEKARFIPGKGYIGPCKKCGIEVVATRRHGVESRTKPKMNKKARKASRKEKEFLLEKIKKQ